MEHHQNKNGECYKEGTSRVETFKVCSFKRPETMFQNEPPFSLKTDSSTDEEMSKEENDDYFLSLLKD